MNVGVGRYRIDLAIRESESAERYLVGIELDGARYASTDTARDRERLRREALIGLGWNHLVRVRAIDWHESPDRLLTQLVERIERSRNEVPLPAPPLSPPPNAAPTALEQTGATMDPVMLPVAAEPGAELAYAPNETVYRPTVLQTVEAAFAWTKSDVVEALAQIVVTEGPVSERTVCRRLADAWGLKRAPAGLSSALPKMLKRLTADRRPTWRDGFLWPNGVTPDVWRDYRAADPALPDTRRDLEDVALEEIANAADALLGRYGTMPREELARAVAKRFGYRALTKGVHKRIEDGIAVAEQRLTAAASA